MDSYGKWKSVTSFVQNDFIISEGLIANILKSDSWNITLSEEELKSIKLQLKSSEMEKCKPFDISLSFTGTDNDKVVYVSMNITKGRMGANGLCLVTYEVKLSETEENAETEE